MSTLVEVPITTSEAQLKQEALERFIELVEAKGFIGWQPSPADLEVILLEVIASFGANAAVVASTVLQAAFIQFGVQFLKLAFNEGASATATTTWAVAPEEGVRTIPAGTELEIGGYGFQVASDTEVPAKAETVNVPVVAIAKGTESNQLKEPAELVNRIAWVTGIVVVGETSNGAEEETPEQYAERLVTALELQAPRPITASDFAKFVLQVPSNILPSGVTVGRATAIDGYNPATNAFEASTVEGSPTIKEVTSFIGITVGTEITDTAKVIPVGATVLSVNEGAKTITLSANATATHAKEAMSAIGSFENGRYVTTFVTDVAGKALSAEAMVAIEEWLGEHREINFKALVRGPSITKVFVTTKIHVLPGYETATVEGAVKAAIEAFLNPASWGNPAANTTGAKQWLNYINGTHVYGTVRYNQLIGVIEAVAGVAYVLAGAEGLKVGLAAAPAGTSDVALPGPAPLPEAPAADVTITTG